LRNEYLQVHNFAIGSTAQTELSQYNTDLSPTRDKKPQSHYLFENAQNQSQVGDIELQEAIHGH